MRDYTQTTFNPMSFKEVLGAYDRAFLWYMEEEYRERWERQAKRLWRWFCHYQRQKAAQNA